MKNQLPLPEPSNYHLLDPDHLKGRVIICSGVDAEGHRQITLSCGAVVAFTHCQDCCEAVVRYDERGVRALRGQILGVTCEAVTVGESRTDSRLIVTTEKGNYQLDMAVESNGYYSESLDILRIR